MNKPLVHITADKGWINDPNAICYFKGHYHIFYQHHPYSCEWGPMHYGHVISDDLIHFKRLPIALTPGDPFDKDGCFSGTALVDNDKLLIAYTGFINNEDPAKIKQIQCLAYSLDGITFHKMGIILDETNLPSEYLPTDFRDPKLFKKDGIYYLMVAAKKKVGGGAILLYKSFDLKKWEFISNVLNHDSEGKMIECVDYHPSLNLLLYSEQDFLSDNHHCLNIHSCEYEIGHLNEEYKFISSGKHLLDYGFDFYAPQVMNDKHYLIAWMNMWDRNNPSAKYGFAGMLTIPRKVEVRDGLLRQTPVIYGELTNKVENVKTYKDNLLVGIIHLKAKNLESLDISLRKGEDEETKFYLKGNKFIFDRSHSGEEIKGREKDEYSLKGMRLMPYLKEEVDDIYLILDRFSVEIFVNGISMSNVIYPKESSDEIVINLESQRNETKVYKLTI